MKRFVVGDIHGAHKALAQCLERSGFDRENDLLISLGDICDGWPEVKECVEEIASLPHHIFIIGNHDVWFLDWLKTGNAPPVWTTQGGGATLESYKAGVPQHHRRFFETAKDYHVDGADLFVHGGFDFRRPIEVQPRDALVWDRAVITQCYRLSLMGKTADFGKYDRVFVGHTTLTNFGLYEPSLFAGSLWALDTGGGWEGKLSIMDIDSLEFWQSDTVADLYPNAPGRTRGVLLRA